MATFGVDSTEVVAAQSEGEGASPAKKRVASNCLQKQLLGQIQGIPSVDDSRDAILLHLSLWQMACTISNRNFRSSSPHMVWERICLPSQCRVPTTPENSWKFLKCNLLP